MQNLCLWQIIQQAQPLIGYWEQGHLHPIFILDSKDKLIALLEHQRVIFGVVRKSVYQAMLKYEGDRFHVSLLKNIGYDYIVRIYK